MEHRLRLLVILVFILWTFDFCADGFSIRSKRLNRSLSKRIGDNGFGIYDIFSASNHQKQTKRKSIKRTNAEHYNSNARLNPGSSALSGVPGCSECFWGLQVSKREAYVVSNVNLYP